MESYLQENFDVQPKHSSTEVLERWRNLCGVVKNPKRRFHFTANLSKRYEAAAVLKANQEKLRIAVLASKAAIQFLLGVIPSDYAVPEGVKAAGFQVCAEELGPIVEGHDVKKLKFHNGMRTQWGKLMATLSECGDDESPLQGKLNGVSNLIRRFRVFVWKALQCMILMILWVCAFVSLIVGLAMEGRPHAAYDGLGTVANILVEVFVTSTGDYRQSLRFGDSDKEKKNIAIQAFALIIAVIKGFRIAVSLYKYKNAVFGFKVVEGSNMWTTLTCNEVLPSKNIIASCGCTSCKLEVQYKFHDHATFTAAVALNQWHIIVPCKLEVQYKFHDHATFTAAVALNQWHSIDVTATNGITSMPLGVEASRDVTSVSFRLNPGLVG